MPVCARTIGGPGAGKTTRGMNIMDLCLEQVVSDPMKIGFVSFTRAARREASERAAVKFGMKASDLEKEGWFRTLHSCCYKLLGVAQGELLVGGKEDNEWLRRATYDAHVTIPSSPHDDDYLHLHRPQTSAGKALALWDAARNRQVPLLTLYDRLYEYDQRLPSLHECTETVALYERAKARDGRLDFTDLLMRYAGRRFTGHYQAPFEDAEPQGHAYRLPVWIHDEAQDMSLLTSLVFKRLSSSSDYVYLMGDFLQAVYGWAGSDGSIFADWPVQKEEELPVSHRCGSVILAKSWEVIRGCRRTGGREAFRAAREGGRVRRSYLEAALAEVKPGEDVLVLGRTNDYARAAAAELDRLLVPWVPTKGGGGWGAPAKMEAVCALHKLRQGQEVTGQEVWRLMDLIPSRHEGATLWERGAKATLEDKSARANMAPIGLSLLECAGATDALKAMISRGDCSSFLDARGWLMARAAVKHGLEALQKPTVRVGTAHSAKGLESDKVIAVNRIPYPTQQAIDCPEMLDEERRLWYVVATRARHELVVADAGGERFPEI